MIVVRTADAPGLPPEALRQILEIATDELLVVIKTEGDDEDPADAAGRAPWQPQPDPQFAISSLGIQSEPTDLRTVVGPGARDLDDVSTLTADVPDEDPRRRPATLADFATPHDGLGRNVSPPAVILDGHAINRLGIPRLREHGAVLGDCRACAHALHATLQAEPDGRYQLVGHFGCKTFNTLGEVAAALNRRSFDPD